MFSWNKIINALKRSRGNINPFTTFKPSGWKCYKTIGSYVSCAFIEIWSTWEVWRALKKLELLTHLSCSPNFCVLHISMNQLLIVSCCLTLRKYFGMFFRDEAHLGGSYLWSCARLFAFISEELREKLTRYILYVSSLEGEKINWKVIQILISCVKQNGNWRGTF